MDITKQIEILNAYNKGEKIYCKSKYDDDWELVDTNHTFNFNNLYCIGKPKSWQETLNDMTDVVAAYNEAIHYLRKKDIVETVTRTYPDGKCASEEIITESNLFELWNIAMKYGQVNEKTTEINKID